MKEAKGDLRTYPANARVITTNGYVKWNGEAVMGRGCAREAALKYPDFPMVLGIDINIRGNHVQYWNFDGDVIWAFPVKHSWKENADIDLIMRSAKEIQEAMIFDSVVMPRPGCGNGNLDWEDVKKVIEPILDDRFTVITYAT